MAIHPIQLKKFLGLFPLESYYCPPEEVLRDEVLRNGSFNLIHQLSQIKIDIELTKPTDFYDAEMKRRRKVSIAGDFQAFIASAEDVILKKLEFYQTGGSEKHLSDIRGILAETEIDLPYLEVWVSKLGVTNAWQKVR